MQEYDIGSLEKIDFDSEKIGVMLLESITSGLYKNPKNSIREYIQNEYDAGATEIRIQIEEDTISITGNSDGMSEKDMALATDIGRSMKEARTNVGFRGIGIWSGIAVCEEIAIFTKKKGEKNGRVLVIDAKGILQDMKDPTKSLVSCLSTRVFLSKPKAHEKEDNKGTHVELRRIYPHLRSSLNQQEIKEFIQQIIPVPISPTFKYAKLIEKKLKDKVPSYKTVTIKLNQKEIFRPPFESDDLSEPEFFKIGKDETLAYVWYSTSGGILPENTRYIVFKMSGFTVGDETRMTLIDNIKINDLVALRWTTGEVHICGGEIRPTSERNDFEASVDYDNLKDDLSDLINEKVLKEVRRRSYTQSAKNRLDQIDALLKEQPVDQQEIVSALALAERLLMLAEGDVKRGHLSKSPNSTAQRKIKKLRNKKEELIKQLGGSVDDRPEEERMEEPEKEKAETNKQTKAKEKEVTHKKKTPREYMLGLQGAYPWRPADLRLLELVFESMQKVFKEKEISRWLKAFKKLLKNKSKKPEE